MKYHYEEREGYIYRSKPSKRAINKYRAELATTSAKKLMRSKKRKRKGDDQKTKKKTRLKKRRIRTLRGFNVETISLGVKRVDIMLSKRFLKFTVASSPGVELIFMDKFGRPEQVELKAEGWSLIRDSRFQIGRLEEQTSHLLGVLKIDDAVVGSAIFEPTYSTSGEILIRYVAIHGERRGRGLGRLLFAGVRKYCSIVLPRAYSFILVAAGEASQKFWEKSGMKTVGKQALQQKMTGSQSAKLTETYVHNAIRKYQAIN